MVSKVSKGPASDVVRVKRLLLKIFCDYPVWVSLLPRGLMETAGCDASKVRRNAGGRTCVSGRVDPLVSRLTLALRSFSHAQSTTATTPRPVISWPAIPAAVISSCQEDVAHAALVLGELGARPPRFPGVVSGVAPSSSGTRDPGRGRLLIIAGSIDPDTHASTPSHNSGLWSSRIHAGFTPRADAPRSRSDGSTP